MVPGDLWGREEGPVEGGINDPRQFPIGIPYVLVNGHLPVDQERCTSVMAGQAVP